MFESYGTPQDELAITTGELILLRNNNNPEISNLDSSRKLKIPSLVLTKEPESIELSPTQFEFCLARAKLEDKTILAASGDRILEYVALGQNESTVYQKYFPYVRSYGLALGGLSMVGAMKRLKSFRKRVFVTCEPIDIEYGDKVVFENSEGELISSNKVIDLNPLKRK